MINKGFEAEVDLQETPNLGATADKPLKQEEIQNRKVDINVLKARAKAIQDKENLRNTIVIVFFLAAKSPFLPKEINFSTKGLSSFALDSVVVICSCFKSELDKFINKAFLCDEVLFNFLCLILCFILIIY